MDTTTPAASTIATPAETILQKIEDDIAAVKNDITTGLVKFIGMVKTGAQILQADADAAVQLIAAHIGEIDSTMNEVKTWLPPIAQTVTANPSALSAVQAALNDAQQVVNGLNAVAATAQAGGTDVQAIASGATAVMSAKSSLANLVANLGLVNTPNQTAVVTPGNPTTAATA